MTTDDTRRSDQTDAGGLTDQTATGHTLTDAERHQAHEARMDKYGSSLTPDNVQRVIDRIADYPEIVAAALVARGGNTDNGHRAAVAQQFRDLVDSWPTGDNGQDYRAAVTQCAIAVRRLADRIALDAAPAPTETTHLLHAFDRQTGICRCGDGPFTVPEWVGHYHAQETPTRTERTDR